MVIPVSSRGRKAAAGANSGCVFMDFNSERAQRMAVTATRAAAYLAGTYTGEGIKYPRKAPIAPAQSPPLGAAATTATPKGAYFPNISPREHTIPAKKLPMAVSARRAFSVCSCSRRASIHSLTFTRSIILHLIYFMYSDYVYPAILAALI